jgi:hypothetical protein
MAIVSLYAYAKLKPAEPAAHGTLKQGRHIQFLFVLVSSIGLAILNAPASSANDLKTDAQLWQELDVFAPLGPNVTATFIGVSREGDTLPNPTLYGGGAMVDLRYGPWTITAGDLWVTARKPTNGDDVEVNVPLVALTYSLNYQGLAISDRNRFEDLTGLPGDPWRYRNRLMFEHPVSGLGPVSGLFMSDEVFYDLARDRWSRNRAQAGIEIPLPRSAFLQVYYMRQDDRYGVPSALNIAGTTLKFELR